MMNETEEKFEFKQVENPENSIDKIGIIKSNDTIVGRFAFAIKWDKSLWITLFGIDEEFRETGITLSVFKQLIEYLKRTQSFSKINFGVNIENKRMIILALKGGASILAIIDETYDGTKYIKFEIDEEYIETPFIESNRYAQLIEITNNK